MSLYSLNDEPASSVMVVCSTMSRCGAQIAFQDSAFEERVCMWSRLAAAICKSAGA